MSKHLFCRDVCLERGEPLAGTGNMAERFIFVRWPRGKWRVPRFESADMGPALSRAIQGAMKQGIHVALVDRVGETDTLPMLQANGMVADFDGEDELAAAIERVTAGEPLAGRPDPRPILLCCTDSRRDACCARFGFATYKALVAAADPAEIQILQATHVGGCRFAASLVLLPVQRRYARLTPEQVPEFLATIRRGDIYLPAYRGQAGLPEAAQVAQHAAMVWSASHSAGAAVQMEAVEWPEPADGLDFVAPLRIGGQRYDVHMRTEIIPVSGRCTALSEEEPELTPRWRALEVVSAR
ncbi:hypothetical protein GCM10007913_24220 [Devosia yakushimensis]|uniref:Sucrase ferredoxin n=1 Tax=Devosia yakushimensis TaxID=470028 RepID=A0ABQ5UFF2_9HYPH|nr:sucrase ferredoxin [Devosia yakushimensis]GLQ10490.1 hypothetical protein GCM10007913_24220 [Devosia yakushimensis]